MPSAWARNRFLLVEVAESVGSAGLGVKLSDAHEFEGSSPQGESTFGSHILSEWMITCGLVSFTSTQ